MNLCCSVGTKTPQTVEPPDTKKSASCFTRAAAAAWVPGVAGWMRAIDERRFCQDTVREDLLRICLRETGPHESGKSKKRTHTLQMTTKINENTSKELVVLIYIWKLL